MRSDDVTLIIILRYVNSPETLALRGKMCGETRCEIKRGVQEMAVMVG